MDHSETDLGPGSHVELRNADVQSSGHGARGASGDDVELGVLFGDDDVVAPLGQIAVAQVEAGLNGKGGLLTRQRADKVSIAFRNFSLRSEFIGVHVDGWVVDTALTVEKNADESVFHIRVGRMRPVSVMRVADHLLVEVDKQSRLAGLWLLEVPPFPNVEATA